MTDKKTNLKTVPGNNQKTSFLKTNLIAMLMIMLSATVASQDSLGLDADYYTLLPMHHPIVQSGNPAAMALANMYNYGHTQLGYSNSKGSYKPSLYGKNLGKYYIDAKQYFVVNKSVFRGSFTYAREKEKELSYSNMEDPYRPTPYLFADSVANNDQTKRETYLLQSEWASRLTDRVTIGARIDYKASLTAQDTDPRAENTLARLNLKPGLILSLGNIKLGGTMVYRYYNQEIDLTTVKSNTVHTVYSLTGLGTYSAHTAPTFSRLYKQHLWGGNLLLMTNRHILTAGAGYVTETVDDGRKESGGTWSAIKNDSRLKGYQYDISEVFTMQNNLRLHQIAVHGKMRQSVGTEILQTLESGENNDTHNWITYSEQDKYESMDYRAALSYQLVRLLSQNKIKYLLKFTSNYIHKQENYYIPNSHIKFRNVSGAVKYLKNIYLGRDQLTVGASLSFNKNISKDIDLANDNAITQNIIYPDYEFNTSSHWGTMLSFKYSTQPAFIKNTMYVKCDFIYKASTSGYFKDESRTGINFNLGVLF